MRRLFFVSLILVSSAAFAANVTVGCPGGTPGDHPSISAALAALDSQGPHTITVTGTCTENVVLNQRERLTIQAPPAQTATILGANPNLPALIARNSTGITLRNLILSSPRAGASIENNSMVTIAGVIAENATNGNAIDAFGGASLVLGGVNAADAVTMRNSMNGMRCEACVAFFSGWVTIENNTFLGLGVDTGRVEMSGERPAGPGGPAQGGPNIIRNNFNGISVSNNGYVEMARGNLIQNNAASGIILNGASASLFGSTAPDGTLMRTTVEGNDRNGASVLFNSTFRSTGPNLFQNNGSVGTPFTAGVSTNHSSMAFLTGTQITGSVGPGVSADSGATVRLDAMTITGSSEEGVRLLHGAILEGIANNNIPVNGTASVTCDGTSIVFGDFTGVAPFECEKATKK